MVQLDLNIKGLAQIRHAKSIHDAAWGSFLDILQAVAVTGLPDASACCCCDFVKRGLNVQKVNPRGTSISCLNCGSRVEKNLADRVHHCPSCGVNIDEVSESLGSLHQARTLTAIRTAGLILNRALLAVGLPLNGCGKSVIDIEEQQVSFVKSEFYHIIIFDLMRE